MDRKKTVSRAAGSLGIMSVKFVFKDKCSAASDSSRVAQSFQQSRTEGALRRVQLLRLLVSL